MAFEVRTTVHGDLLDENDINLIVDDLILRGYDKTYYLQPFLDTDTTLGDMKRNTKKLERALLSEKLEIVIR
jgi:pyruvate formate lyase activating enzyme